MSRARGRGIRWGERDLRVIRIPPAPTLLLLDLRSNGTLAYLGAVLAGWPCEEPSLLL
jgi:hypothetical protein